MGADGVVPDEATFTSVARLAAAKDDPALAFDLVKQMADHKHIVPRLRSYGPALFGFCKRGDGDGAYAVDAHMDAAGVLPEEPELAALIKVSSEVGRAEKVYEFLQRTRATVRQVSEATAEVVEDWFASPAAAEAGVEEWDGEEVKKGVVRGGGGWHGVGWLGVGEWNVVKTEMSGEGECRACGERLVSIDIDPTETENFATSLATLACSKEARADFSAFQV